MCEIRVYTSSPCSRMIVSLLQGPSMDASSQSPETFLQSGADESQETHVVNDEIDKDAKTVKKTKKKKNRAVLKECSATSRSSSSRVACKRRRPLGPPPRRVDVAEAVSFRLGMSIAAFLSQVLETKDGPNGTTSADHLGLICASAVRESLTNDFGDVFDSFVSNFEKSFRSTFRTLRLIKESSIDKGNSRTSELSVEVCTSGGAYDVQDYHPEEMFRTSATDDRSDHSETTEVNGVTDSANLGLVLHGQMNQLTRVSTNPFESTTNQSSLSTYEKSVMEQTRSNDLKAMELTLFMEKLKMKKTQLALNFDSNNLERSKLAMGASKASFKAEKFKTQLEDVRNAELLRKCVDCLVAGLLIMLGSLTYGAYVYSYNEITEATASCTPSTKKSSSWWFSNPMDKLNSGMQMLSCQFQVVIRMVFGFIMILSVTYLLLQRSASTKQPITFIIILLALLCGFAGKICVDTLGGSGFHWLIIWEIICIVHLVCNVCTSALFAVLYGPLMTDQGTKDQDRPRIAYWVRRLVFYGAVLVFLPLFCGLLPFASVGEWRDHFRSLIADYLFITRDD